MSEDAVEIPIAADVRRVRKLAEGCNVLFLVTSHGVDVHAPARPMRLLAIDDSGVAWFFIDTTQGAGREFTAPTQVTLAWHDLLHNRWVSAAGQARIVHDRARAGELWTPEQSAWMPGGLATPGLALLAVDLTRVSWWNVEANILQRLLARARTSLGRPYRPRALTRGCIDLRMQSVVRPEKTRRPRVGSAHAAEATQAATPPSEPDLREADVLTHV